MQRQIPVFIAFIFGTFMLVQFFLTSKATTRMYTGVLDWVQIIYVFTLLVGALSFARFHLLKVAKAEKTKFYNLLTLLALFFMLMAGFGWGTDANSVFMWVFNWIQVPMQSTVFALLAFFVASAAYRGFKARSIEAFLLLLTASLVMLGRVPLGSYLSQAFPDLANWILTVPSMAARRGILIGIGLGVISTSLRIILGIERTYLGKE